tara:strand:- start:109 stop:276 length:168 start_codon:yes stop_codon:yes gene_type:complete
MNITKITLRLYLLILVFALGKYTYLDPYSGGGIFIPGIGGYHLDFKESHKSGAYQ